MLAEAALDVDDELVGGVRPQLEVVAQQVRRVVVRAAVDLAAVQERRAVCDRRVDHRNNFLGLRGLALPGES